MLKTAAFVCARLIDLKMYFSCYTED